jgi:hypothetical protein
MAPPATVGGQSKSSRGAIARIRSLRSRSRIGLPMFIRIKARPYEMNVYAATQIPMRSGEWFSHGMRIVGSLLSWKLEDCQVQWLYGDAGDAHQKDEITTCPAFIRWQTRSIPTANRRCRRDECTKCLDAAHVDLRSFHFLRQSHT